MGKGNLLGQEQKSARRQQIKWANVQDRQYRAQLVDPIEVLRRREALRERLARGQHNAEQVRLAEQEAEERRERDRLEAEANARELYRLERERIKLLRKAREAAEKLNRQQLNAQQELQRKGQEEAARLQRLALEQAEKDQYEADLETFADIRADLPVLKTKAQDALRRTEKVRRVLSATPGQNLTTANNNRLLLNQIVARCTLSIASVDLAWNMMMAANIKVIEAATRQAIVGLQQVLTDCAVDDPAATNALADTVLAEGTYAASLALMALYPNLNLTHDLIGKNNGPTARLNAGQLVTLNTKLASHPVQSWIQTNLPANRPLGNISCWIPNQLLNFPFQPGGEIFCDWVFVNDNHGYTASAMLKYLTPISNGTMTITQGLGFVQQLVRTASTGGNQLVTMNNSNLRIVFNNTMTLLITYFIA